jgi:hypothetical protein
MTVSAAVEAAVEATSDMANMARRVSSAVIGAAAIAPVIRAVIAPVIHAVIAPVIHESGMKPRMRVPGEAHPSAHTPVWRRANAEYPR